MQYTPEQLKDLRDAIDAHLRGEALEYFDTIYTSKGWKPTKAPAWNSKTILYRPAPKPVTRPWSKPEDVPGPVCWIRQLGSGRNERLIVHVDQTGLFAGRSESLLYGELSSHEHSTDRKTWNPCTVTE